MKAPTKSFPIPAAIMGIHGLTWPELELLSHLAEHPGYLDGQLAELTQQTQEEVQALINHLCKHGHLRHARGGGPRRLLVIAASPLTKAQAQELARAKVELTRLDLTVQVAGDILLSLLEQKLFWFRITDYAGIALYIFKLSPLGLAVLLESGLLRQVQARRARVTGHSHRPHAGVGENRLSAATEPTASMGHNPTHELSAVERLPCKSISARPTRVVDGRWRRRPMRT